MSAVSCERHPFDHASGRCRSCGFDFCEACLVYTHGPKRPPLCIPCALVAAGIRHGRQHRQRRGLFGRRQPELVTAGHAHAEAPEPVSAAAPPPPPPPPPAPAPPPPPPPPRLRWTRVRR
jgi:hypothetical protein